MEAKGLRAIFFSAPLLIYFLETQAKYKTNTSVDAILLMIQQVDRVLWEVFPVTVVLINAA